jgi:hypothetical protein
MIAISQVQHLLRKFRIHFRLPTHNNGISFLLRVNRFYPVHLASQGDRSFANDRQLKTLRQIPLTCARLRSIGPMMIIKKILCRKNADTEDEMDRLFRTKSLTTIFLIV